jgi:hypothetical protein
MTNATCADLQWHVEAAIERLLDLPPEQRQKGSLVWSALFFLHEGLAEKRAGLTSKDSTCHICGAKAGTPHKGIVGTKLTNL